MQGVETGGKGKCEFVLTPTQDLIDLCELPNFFRRFFVTHGGDNKRFVWVFFDESGRTQPDLDERRNFALSFLNEFAVENDEIRRQPRNLRGIEQVVPFNRI